MDMLQRKELGPWEAVSGELFMQAYEDTKKAVIEKGATASHTVMGRVIVGNKTIWVSMKIADNLEDVK